MKSLYSRIALAVFAVAIFSSCQRQASCNVYSGAKGKPMYKATYLKDTARR